MNTLNKPLTVQIVQLEPLHVASALGFGTSPEAEAWKKLLEWARKKGLLTNKPKARFFGFNNPSPSHGSPNYGYEQWMTVEPDVQGDEAITIKDFPGGRYAVTRCQLHNIETTWKALVAWSEASPYRWTHNHHQWLEEAITPPLDSIVGKEDAQMDLYLPILD